MSDDEATLFDAIVPVQWEYVVRTFARSSKHDSEGRTLNENLRLMGERGWEVVSCTYFESLEFGVAGRGPGYDMVFKRPKRPVTYQLPGA